MKILYSLLTRDIESCIIFNLVTIVTSTSCLLNSLYVIVLVAKHELNNERHKVKNYAMPQKTLSSCYTSSFPPPSLTIGYVHYNVRFRKSECGMQCSLFHEQKVVDGKYRDK